MAQSSVSIAPKAYNDLKIGVGISTTPNRVIDHRIYKNSLPTNTIVIQSDNSKRGVSHSRNALLNELSECDYVFLFDDDCFPMMSGWESYFISQANEHNLDFIALPEFFKTELLKVDGEMGRWQNCMGCFSFQTKRALQVIGGFNTNYIRYGFEDTARNYRAYAAGLTGGYNCSCPIRALSYIHSMDVFSENPPSNLSQNEKNELIKINETEFKQEVTCGQLFYPYT